MQTRLNLTILAIIGTASGLAVPSTFRGPMPRVGGPSHSSIFSPAKSGPKSNIALRGGGAPIMSADFGVKVLAPLFGNVIGTMMFLSSTPAVLQAKKTGKLGNLNPSPFPALIGNCAAWLFYAIHIMNWWIMVPNISGICIGAYFTLSTYPLCSAAQQDTMRKTLLAYVALFSSVLAGLHFNLIKASTQTAYGLMANFCLLFFYAAPLTTLAEVIKKKDASSIDPLLAACGTANGIFWGIYGTAIGDLYVSVPNGIGAVMSAMSTLARVIIGVKK